MADLISQPALTGLPVTLGRATVAALDPGRVTSIAPYPGRDLSTALAPLRFPAPGEVVSNGSIRLVWAGREMAFLLGAPAPDLTGLAAVTDQSDGWVWVSLEGDDAAAVLARLSPLDLRPASFAPGTAARSTLNHLPALIIRTSETRFELASFRSMAGTLKEELHHAMQAVAARAAL
ncbi:sarcosine oxidase subunit gamma [Pararhodobacter zhoushanensis]|uniref:sarcosine oxidase subunit gamma n=1 Tax=Pararhodobacter zhoushanensis TaxID=2479545 RepID=UPI000F8C6628|nr:sarcosine oxidase subunit gamma [Pararhodobacter zhoushanensis]